MYACMCKSGNFWHLIFTLKQSGLSYLQRLLLFCLQIKINTKLYLKDGYLEVGLITLLFSVLRYTTCSRWTCRRLRIKTFFSNRIKSLRIVAFKVLCPQFMRTTILFKLSRLIICRIYIYTSLIYLKCHNTVQNIYPHYSLLIILIMI